jgi:hypothetical protein
MVIVGVLAGTASVVMQILAPRYVQSVLDVDAADAVYVFGPSVIGLLLALAAAPAVVRRWGERTAALLGFCVTTTALFLLGLVDPVANVVDPVNPAHLANLLGAGLGEALRTAALLALPLGFGVSLTTTSVQIYVNRRVPLSYQGRAFALQSTLKNGAAIVPLLTLGAAAGAFGVEKVLLASPLLLLVVAVAIIQLSVHLSGPTGPSHLEVLQSFWEEPED